MKKEMNNKGFSLVELIIVIAIMAVLMGVLAPQYLKYVKQSKISTDITNAEQIATAINVAVADSVNASATSIAITSGAAFGAGTTLTTSGSTTVSAPAPKVSASLQWAVEYNMTDGVTKITLGSKEIWPTSTEYESWAKAN